MVLTRLEHLPNELFYFIFSYINGIDLCLAFSDLNTRLNQLLYNVSSHQSLDLTSGSISYRAFRAYITDRYDVRSSFISSLKIDCFNLSPFGIKDLFSCFINTSISNRLQRLTILTSEFASIDEIDIVTLLDQMMIANKQGYGRLQYLTLRFEYFNLYYTTILTKIIQRNISFDTMIFNINKYIARSILGGRFRSYKHNINLHIAIDIRPSLRNTVHLSLSLENSSDLVLLLQRGVLPSLQQLIVVFERHSSNIDPRPVRFKFNEANLLTTDTTQLRTLSLRNLHMRSALMFIRFLRLSQLHTLHLINISDNTLTRIDDFERAISIRLYNLITLQFTLRFRLVYDQYNKKPYCVEDYVILQNNIWQSRGWFVRDYIDIEKKYFTIYTVPYALSSDRSLRNHAFIAAQQPEYVNSKTYELLSWTCTYINRSASDIAQSLYGLREARQLFWNFEAGVFPLLLTSWSQMQLRSLMLLLNLQKIEDRANVIKQILFVCPRLHTLAVRSKDLSYCLERKPTVTISSLDHLHLYVDEVDEMVDAVHLAAVFPNISCLSTGTSYLRLDTRICDVVQNLIKTLPYLRRLRFNDHNCSYKHDAHEPDNNLLVHMLQNIEQLRSIDCCVKIFSSRRLVIWI